MKFGTETYREAGLERLDDARLLLERGRYAASVYLAGVAVESMLRSLIWINDKTFEERHDLRSLAIRIDDLGLLRRSGHDLEFVADVQEIAQCWSNNFRYCGKKQLEVFLAQVGLTRGNRPGQLRHACSRHVARCSSIVHRCELLLKRLAD